VIGAIGEIGVTGSEAKLAEILANEEAHFTVRVQAANALGGLLRTGSSQEQDEDGSPLDPNAVLTRAVFDASDAVCQAALKALVDMDAENAVATLSKFLQNRPSATETSSHTDSAGKRDVDNVEQEIPQELDRLITGHDATTSTLAAMLTPAAEEAPAVVESPQDDGQEAPSNAVRILAARLLGGLPAPGAQAVRDLMDAYGQGDEGLRREIIVALGRIGDHESLPVVVQGLAAHEHEIRSAALDALERFPGVSAADEHLVKLLADEDAYIRERAVQTIGAVKSPTALGALPGMLNDSDRAVCRAALRALPGDTKSEELSARIFDLMFEFSAELVVDAATALRRMDDWGSASRLVAMLDDPQQEEFHWICIDALAEMFAREPGTES
jgi:HEAT repeat protein